MVMGDSLARALTRRSYREVMEKIDRLPPLKATKIAAQHREIARHTRNALGDLLLDESTLGKGRNMTTLMLAVLPAARGRFAVLLSSYGTKQGVDYGTVFNISEHAMQRLQQGGVDIAAEIRAAAHAVLYVVQEAMDRGVTPDYEALRHHFGGEDLLTPHGRFRLQPNEGGPMLAVTWIPDSASSPARARALEARRAAGEMFA